MACATESNRSSRSSKCLYNLGLAECAARTTSSTVADGPFRSIETTAAATNLRRTRTLCRAHRSRRASPPSAMPLTILEVPGTFQYCQEMAD
ncbi:Uncharacterised protein [Mycobacteroides abscessus subsp. abscessus]|nr:Uncharacterised protein [Mycobacteroides abscessus subsp. abscessus]